MPTAINSIEALEAQYPAATNPKALTKVHAQITPAYHRWISASRFCVLTTVGPEGTDGSPRGDADPVVQIANAKTLLLPDWRGNNRLDSLRNIVRDGRVSLMFMVPGSNNVVRVNGTAILTADEALCQRFNQKGRNPATVIVVTITELYFQCAKAVMRSALWTSDDESIDLPSAGDFLKEVDEAFDGKAYDDEYPAYADKFMW